MNRKQKIWVKQFNEESRHRENDIRREKRNFHVALNKSVKEYFNKMSDFETVERFQIALEYTTFSAVAIKDALDRLYLNSANTYVPLTIRQTLGSDARAAQILVDLQNRNPVFRQDMMNYVNTTGVEDIKSIIDLNKATMRKIIDENLEKGPRKLARVLQKEFNISARWRAERIARTEVLKASSYASELASRELVFRGIGLKKVWLSNTIRNFRPAHLALNFTEKPYDGYFEPNGNKMWRPHDIGAPASEVINCGCTLKYEPL